MLGLVPVPSIKSAWDVTSGSNGGRSRREDCSPRGEGNNTISDSSVSIRVKMNMRRSSSKREDRIRYENYPQAIVITSRWAVEIYRFSHLNMMISQVSIGVREKDCNRSTIAVLKRD
jgi:hypothetical protein